VSDLSELFEQLAVGPVLLATAFDSADADCDNGGSGFSGCSVRRIRELEPRSHALD
jgi:hypothetical protein